MARKPVFRRQRACCLPACLPHCRCLPACLTVAVCLPHCLCLLYCRRLSACMTVASVPPPFVRMVLSGCLAVWLRYRTRKDARLRARKGYKIFEWLASFGTSWHILILKPSKVTFLSCMKSLIVNKLAHGPCIPLVVH